MDAIGILMFLAVIVIFSGVVLGVLSLVRLEFRIHYSLKVALELEEQLSWYEEADTADKADIALDIVELIDSYDQGKLTKEMKKIVANIGSEMILASTVSATVA